MFKDVNASTAHHDEIWWMAEMGISAGWDVKGGKEFRPYATVARADMAAFLHRIATKAGRGTDIVSDPSMFADVSVRTAHAEDIGWLASAGVFAG